jgi:NADPH-dependent glutamate synthase beta subunit-like oxidoreductase
MAFDLRTPACAPGAHISTKYTSDGEREHVAVIGAVGVAVDVALNREGLSATVPAV